MPQRVQRKRVKGWRMPEDTVYVGRPTRWGNPYLAGKLTYLTGPKAGQKATSADVVRMFENVLSTHRAADVRREIRDVLGGKNLACWCPLDQPCHADVLLAIANAPSSVSQEGGKP